MTKSGWLPTFTNKVLLEHDHTLIYSYLCLPWTAFIELSDYNRDPKSMNSKISICPLQEGLPISEVRNMGCRLQYPWKDRWATMKIFWSSYFKMSMKVKGREVDGWKVKVTELITVWGCRVWTLKLNGISKTDGIGCIVEGYKAIAPLIRLLEKSKWDNSVISSINI